jgi:type I restriction enzyme M protein
MVFAPYTSIFTNLLFFDRAGPTRDVWYYEQPLPEGRKSYTKTQPLRFEEFESCQAWWSRREENEHAWKVPAAELLASNCNFDRKNPRAKEDIAHLPPEQIAASIMEKERRILEIVGDIKKLLAHHPNR